MAHNSNNIYRIARDNAKYSQEGAAEILNLSVESLRAYETGRTVPGNDIVCHMVAVYGAQHLAYQHLMHSSEVARRCLPELEDRNLPEAILQLQRDVSEFIKCRDDLIDIGCDGIIDDHERQRYDEICGKLDNVVKAIMALKFARTKDAADE